MPRSSPLFAFEAEYAEALQLIPLAVRRRLDLTGVRLSLAAWEALPYGTRADLVRSAVDGDLPDAAWRAALEAAVAARTGKPPETMRPISPDAWNTPEPPAPLRAAAAEAGASLPASVWARLAPLERYALVKLGRPGRPSPLFRPALREFGLSAEAG